MSLATSKQLEGGKTEQSAENTHNEIATPTLHQQHFISIHLPELAKLLKSKLSSSSKKEEEETNSKTDQDLIKLPSQFDDTNQIFFGCAAPLRPDYIDINLQKTSEIEVNYCCGFYFPLDCSFLVDKILSLEFLTGISKQASKYPNEKRIAIFIHGGALNIDNKKTMAECVLNESILFYENMPFLVIPFIWPAQDRLVASDKREKAIEKIGEELAEFVMRICTKFDQIDFIGHGRGCNVLMEGLKKIFDQEYLRPKIANSHIAFVAPDVPAVQFDDYVRENWRFVKKFILYVNTNDWVLFASKFLNGGKNRAGATTTIIEEEIETIDTSKILSDWKSTNHYYLIHPAFKKDIADALNDVSLNKREIQPIQHKNGIIYYELIKKDLEENV